MDEASVVGGGGSLAVAILQATVGEGMSFAGKDQQRAWHSQIVQRVIEQIIFTYGDANVVGAPDNVSRGADFVDLVDGGFVVIALLRFPR